MSHRALLLPGTGYTRLDSVVGTGNLEGTLSEETHRLRAGGSAVLYTLVLSTDGSICVYHNGWSLAKVNDTVIQYRLVTSSVTAEIYQDMPLDLAQSLYDLRVETLNSPEDPGAQTGTPGPCLYAYRISAKYGELAECIPLTEEQLAAIEGEALQPITQGFGFSASLHTEEKTISYSEVPGVP